MREERGFTLVEILISMVILGILISSVGGALFISLRTTEATKHRFAQSHDVQIASAYLANDVQSASDVQAPSDTANCSGAFTTLVTLTYSSSGHPNAVYKCGSASNGETQITRTFNGGTPLVLAHFAGTARPNVVVTYDTPTHPTIPVSVTITLTKAADCTLDCTYILFGYRRTYDPTGGVTQTVPPGDIVLLSTGAQSPLWVQGSCLNGGTDPAVDCVVDPLTLALPTSDVATTGWTTTQLPTTSLYDKLRDKSDGTWVSTISQNSIAKVALSPVTPPAGANPTVEIRAASAGAAAKLKVHIYDSSTGNQLVVSGNINVNSSIDNSGDWTLNNTERAPLDAALVTDPTLYQHLMLGVEMTNPRTVNVYGLALSTAGPGLLTVKGPLYVNSQKNGSDGNYAITLTGAKSAPKLSIAPPGTTKGDYFQIWQPGSCSGCSNFTVSCPLCNGGWVPKGYPQSIPDPLRALPPVDPATLGTGSCNGSGICQPGVYSSFSRSSNTTLNPGIYYLQTGMSIQGSATLSCAAPCTGGVLLYVADGSVSFTGSSRVSLPAISSGIYKGLVLFQWRTDLNALKFAGNSGSSAFCTMGGIQYGNCLDGIVYVPNAQQVTLATGTASLAAKAIVAQNIKVSSSVTIG